MTDVQPNKSPVGRWTFRACAVRRHHVLVAVALFVLVVITRAIGLAEPKDPMSDEYLYTRSAADYLNGKSPGEWTHPPLSKELMTLSIGALARLHTTNGTLPVGLGPLAAVDRGRIAWATSSGVAEGVLSAHCGVDHVRHIPLKITPTALAVSAGTTVVGGRVDGRGALLTVKNGSAVSTVSLVEVPVHVAHVRGTTLWTSGRGVLGIVRGTDRRSIATGAADVIGVDVEKGFWVSFPDQHRVRLYGLDGNLRRSLSIPGVAGALAAPVSYERGRAFHTMAAVTIDGRDRHVWALDPNFLLYVFPSRVAKSDYRAEFVAPGRGGFVWSAAGREIRAADALGLSGIHSARAPSRVRALLSDGRTNTAIAVTDTGTVCVGWSPLFALRFPSALAGALLISSVFLLAVRLSGSTLFALAGAALSALDGFSYTLARLAGPDYVVGALVVAGWFCLVSALHVPVDGGGSRRTRTWLAAAGVAGGLAAAAKWNGVWALGVMGLVTLWDLRAHRRAGLGSAFSAGRVASVFPILLLAISGVIAYLAVWGIHAGIVGAGLGEVIHDHSRMLAYHANAHGFASFESYWYQWPLGAKPVPIFVGKTGLHRAEMWIIANPVVAYSGAIALIGLSVLATKRKRMDLMILPIAALAVYVPWIYVVRTPFLYQYSLVTPFLAVAVPAAAANLWSKRGSAIVVGVLVVAAAAMFVWLLPMMIGWSMSSSYFVSVRHWLPWMFNPPRLPLVG